MKYFLLQCKSRSTRTAPAIVVAGFVACTILSVHAQSRFEEDFDDRDKPWQEIAVHFPAPPKTENLRFFYVSPIATQSFAIDSQSLTIDSDGVIRYTMVSRSESGAENISYEGIRCQSREKKLYALGHKDGTWSRSRRDQWEPINNSGANRQQAALARDYFCKDRAIAGTPEYILGQMKKQPPHS